MKAKLILNNKEYEVELKEEQVKEIEKPKYKRWRAEEGGKYYFLSDLGEILSANDCRDKSDNFLYNTDNYFKTKEEAEFCKKQLLYLQQYKDYLGDDLVTEDDWKSNSSKYFAYYDFYEKKIKIGEHHWNKTSNDIYSKSETKIKDFIIKIGNDNFKKYILEVDD